jgi:ferredoxin
MSIRKMTVAALAQWAEELARGGTVYAPVARGDRFVYDRLRRAAELRLDHDVTLLPPKKYLLPPRERLLRFEASGAAQSAEAEGPFILFGVHPYDVAAIAQADAYYLKENPDSHYAARRANATIVACDAQNASPNVFAACMGTAVVKEGWDALLTRVDGEYVVEARTPAGEALLARAGNLPPADAIALARREQAWQDAQRLLRRHELKCRPDELPALLARAYEHEVWEKKSGKCHSCGSCVLVCPSCFCFDVQDEVNWDLCTGERCRRWDACLLRDFALVAGGHNFRKNREERYRHRFYRKGKYLSERMGFVACVGCGRCVGACTTGIANPVELYNALLED